MAPAHPEPTPVERISSGIPNFDRLLHGGLFRGGVYLVAGESGSGKTTLANQLCFHTVREGGYAVYVSLLAEGHSQLFAHLRSYAFFDLAVVGDALQYFSAYTNLEQGGLSGLFDMLSQTMRQHKASLLVIDGFETAKAMASDDLQLKRFLHQLQAYAEAMRSTILLLTQLPSDSRSPDLTMVDGIVTLSDERVGLRRVREIEVLKLRGSSYLRGRHFFAIGDEGITIHPRTEALYATMPPAAAPSDLRYSTGLPRLDDMLGGGLVPQSITMLHGSPGGGKTSLGLLFLAAGAALDEPGLYFGMFEQPARLVERATMLGLPFNAYIDRGLLELAWQWPREDIIDLYAERILAAVSARNVRRLVIDGLDGLRHTVYQERLPLFFTALLDELRARGVTTVFTSDMQQVVGPAVELPVSTMLSTAVDTIVFMRSVELRGQLRKLISILKHRGSGYDPAIRELRIHGTGIEIAAAFESTEASLTGVARPLPA